MQPTTIVRGVSFRKEPRRGQLKVFNALDANKECLNVKLPTGYGKTATMCGVYAILQHQGRVNRLLVIFPTDAQLEQFEADGHHELRNVNLPGSQQVVDLRFYPIGAVLKKHRSNQAQVYAITVQSLIESRGWDNCATLMSTGNWMVCVDEYHHYGVDKSWAKSVLSLNRQFLLAMSATPNRKSGDSAFGDPHVATSYREAAEIEGVVKPLIGHAYHYKIDAIGPDEEIHTYTTKELAEAAGSDNPDAIERYRIKRQMRWSPKYVSPLVAHSIERMLQQRLTTGHRLQALVFAMCVSHAEMVCDQLRTIFPELKIDWVGTGEHGRSREKNTEIKNRFLPKKDDDGRRPAADLDVLVNVGIAGEGLDTINVSEIIHLTNASICNRNNQIKGRAARYLPGVVGNINFDASSEFATKGYIGGNIMDAMDFVDPSESPHPDDCQCALCQSKARDERLPEEPTIQIFNMELIEIDSGDPGVQRMATVLYKRGAALDLVAMQNDRKHPEWRSVISLFREMRAIEAEPHNEKAIITQWEESVSNALRVVTGKIIKLMIPLGHVEKSLAGDIKKRINARKKFELGEISRDIEVLKKHYRWLTKLEEEIINKRLPLWLE